jgi:Flp pilus assembly protein CpaB
MALATPRRLSGEALSTTRPRPLRSRVSGGHVVMIVAGVLGMLLTLVVVRSADHRVKVAVAAGDIAVGERVRPSAIRYERVAMDAKLLATVLQPGDVAKLRNSIAAQRISAGELVTRRAVRPVAASAGRRAMSIPVDPSRAVDGKLAPGDRVDVLVATDTQIAVAVANVEVLSVNRPGRGGALGDVGAKFSVTVAVDAKGAQRVAAAITAGDLDIVRSTGAKSAQDLPPLPLTRVDAAGSGTGTATRSTGSRP